MIFNKLKKGNNRGFSLVELIVVIAVMAVLLAVLAPSLLQYVERSRAQKDDSAMSEVTNAVKLDLADQDVYDELLQYNEKENVASYADRVSDETPWETSDEETMRGVTITFESENQEIILENGQINIMKDGLITGKLSDLTGAEDAKLGVLYNRLRSVVGEN